VRVRCVIGVLASLAGWGGGVGPAFLPGRACCYAINTSRGPFSVVHNCSNHNNHNYTHTHAKHTHAPHPTTHRPVYPEVDPLTPEVVAVMLCSLSYLEETLKVRCE